MTIISVNQPAHSEPPMPSDSALLAPGARLQTLATGFSFTEGPASDPHGNVYFTDQPNDRIVRFDARNGKFTIFLSPCGRSNGLCFDAQGDLWACADGENQLWRITASGKHTVVISDEAGKLLNGPNDVWVRPDGGLYFTDPYYERDYWTDERKQKKIEQPGENVYFLTPDHKTLTRVVSDMRQPNGIIGTPDGKTLYIADIGTGKTYAYHIETDGSLSGKHLFCALGSDGMTLDSDGNVYLTGKGVTVFDKSGQQVLQIPVPEGWTGNICFGGTDKKLLFITASKSVYTLKMRVHGVGSQ